MSGAEPGHDALKLTTYLGERERAGNRFLADALVDVYARHGVRTSCLLRGIEGFGARHALQTQRLLSLSEDLPVVSVAVDRRERIEALLGEVTALQRDGLVTLEHARLLDEDLALAPGAAGAAGTAAKLTVYVGRQERAGGRPAHLAVVDALHAAGVAGATVLLGVDGTVHGTRRRARVVARNAAVPLMIVSVGETTRIAAALPRLRALLEQPPLVTLERVTVHRRDGVRLAAPELPASTADAGSGGPLWRKLIVYASEQSRHRDEVLYAALVRRLRAEGAAGATALRGLWGYHGEHAPHGDRFWSLRRRVPVVTVVIDTLERSARWLAIADELTDETGLLTSELVRPLRAGAP